MFNKSETFGDEVDSRSEIRSGEALLEALSYRSVESSVMSRLVK